MRACGFQHEPFGAHPVESHLHQGVAAHGPHAQDHPLAEGAVPHPVPGRASRCGA